MMRLQPREGDDEGTTLLDGAPRLYRYGLWEETRRALRDWPDDPAINVAWVRMDGPEGPVTLQMDRHEAGRIAALDLRDEELREIGAEPDSWL